MFSQCMKLARAGKALQTRGRCSPLSHRPSTDEKGKLIEGVLTETARQISRPGRRGGKARPAILTL